MNGEERLSEWAKEARRWLEESSARGSTIVTGGEEQVKALWEGEGGLFNALGLPGLHVSLVENGCARCTLRIPSHLTDENGNWQTGSIAAVIDDVGAAAIVSVDGIIKVSVQFDISYFYPAEFNEEVEIESRVVERKDMLTAVVVEVRKKGTGELVAIGRQWMSAASRGKKIANT
ncbi:Thioesterase superfamily protein [Rhynchospora pubera]|uniref:Thioesterase superfamily protein n=1 Tax=Rhynchospora pubera TaxID=906938 RepID=A0AAV8HNY9_9POAL|nr:Thioesterase superfamily protein [Rhynchospora pubera]